MAISCKGQQPSRSANGAHPCLLSSPTVFPSSPTLSTASACAPPPPSPFSRTPCAAETRAGSSRSSRLSSTATMSPKTAAAVWWRDTRAWRGRAPPRRRQRNERRLSCGSAPRRAEWRRRVSVGWTRTRRRPWRSMQRRGAGWGSGSHWGLELLHCCKVVLTYDSLVFPGTSFYFGLLLLQQCRRRHSLLSVCGVRWRWWRCGVLSKSKTNSNSQLRFAAVAVWLCAAFFHARGRPGDRPDILICICII